MLVALGPLAYVGAGVVAFLLGGWTAVLIVGGVIVGLNILGSIIVMAM